MVFDWGQVGFMAKAPSLLPEECLFLATCAERRCFFVSCMVWEFLITLVLGTLTMWAVGNFVAARAEREKAEEPEVDHAAMPYARSGSNLVHYLPPAADSGALPLSRASCCFPLVPTAILFFLNYAMCVSGVLWFTWRSCNQPCQGLPWEFYHTLCLAGCMSSLVQAILVVCTKCTCGITYDLHAFPVALVVMVIPYVSDSFDTLKDVQLAGLFICTMETESNIWMFIGVFLLVWLFIIHVYYLWNRDTRLEMAASYLAVLLFDSKAVRRLQVSVSLSRESPEVPLGIQTAGEDGGSALLVEQVEPEQLRRLRPSGPVKKGDLVVEVRYSPAVRQSAAALSSRGLFRRQPTVKQFVVNGERDGEEALQEALESNWQTMKLVLLRRERTRTEKRMLALSIIYRQTTWTKLKMICVEDLFQVIGGVVLAFLRPCTKSLLLTLNVLIPIVRIVFALCLSAKMRNLVYPWLLNKFTMAARDGNTLKQDIHLSRLNEAGKADLWRHIDRADTAMALLEVTGRNPNMELNKFESTPLHNASCAEVVQVLVAYKADPNAKDRVGLTPFHTHAENVRRWATEEAGLQPGTQSSLLARVLDGCRQYLPEPLRPSWCRLSEEEDNGGVEERLEFLLSRGAEVQLQLVKAKADPNASDDAGQTPLCLAMSIEVVHALVAAQADPNLKDRAGQTPLCLARNAEVQSALVDSGADPNGKNEDGQTPMHLAKSAEVQIALVQARADPNAKDYGGQTPLHHALSPEVQVALVHARADPQARDYGGQTPLFLALDARVVQAMVNARANPNARDRAGNMPLDRARMMGLTEVAEALLAAGAEPDPSSMVSDEDSEHSSSVSIHDLWSSSEEFGDSASGSRSSSEERLHMQQAMQTRMR